jgi:hypothetical protein
MSQNKVNISNIESRVPAGNNNGFVQGTVTASHTYCTMDLQDNCPRLYPLFFNEIYLASEDALNLKYLIFDAPEQARDVHHSPRLRSHCCPIIILLTNTAA